MLFLSSILYLNLHFTYLLDIQQGFLPSFSLMRCLRQEGSDLRPMGRDYSRQDLLKSYLDPKGGAQERQSALS